MSVVDLAHIASWMDEFVRAWKSKDAAGAAALFTPDGLFEAIPGVARQTFRGRAEIEAYWADITAAQSDVEVLVGEPIFDGRRVAVEMWVTLRSPRANPHGDHWATLIETNVLEFAPDGRCSRMVEYWNLRPERIEPPIGWGRPSA